MRNKYPTRLPGTPKPVMAGERRLSRSAVLFCLLCMLCMLGACGTTKSPGMSMRPESDPDPTAQLALGRILLQTDPVRAEQVLLTALASTPRNADMLNDLGVARDLQGHHAEAQAAYREALSAAPTLRAARINLALSLALSGENANALTIVQPIAATPSSAGAEQADVAAINSLAGASLARSLPKD
jgi:Flp pilus assembly protein TadD